MELNIKTRIMEKYIVTISKGCKNIKVRGYIIFSCCFVWVWSLVSHTEAGIQAEGVWE